jgi:hypothetical protein
MFRLKRVEQFSSRGPLTEVERYTFDLNGFLIRRGALRPDELGTIHTAIADRNDPPPGPDLGSQRFQNYLTGNPVFRSLIDHPAVVDVLVELCGPAARLDHTYGIIMAPGTDGLSLHGGGTPHDPSQFYAVRDGEIHNGLVAVQWALVDHDLGFGGAGDRRAPAGGRRRVLHRGLDARHLHLAGAVQPPFVVLQIRPRTSRLGSRLPAGVVERIPPGNVFATSAAISPAPGGVSTRSDLSRLRTPSASSGKSDAIQVRRRVGSSTVKTSSRSADGARLTSPGLSIGFPIAS